MNFIEQMFHVSPDGGSGILELSIVLVVLAAGMAAAWSRLRHRAPATTQHSTSLSVSVN